MLVEIPLQQIPNQKIEVVINNNNLNIALYTAGDFLFIDLTVNNNIIILGAKVVNRAYINQYPYVFNDYLFFATTDNSSPYYLTLGDITHLYYSDFDALSNDYKNWLGTYHG